MSCTRTPAPAQAPPTTTLAPSPDIGTIPPAVDLTGSWTTGSGPGEPTVPAVTINVQCPYHAAVWVISQRSDSIQAWSFPAYPASLRMSEPGA